MLVLNLTTFNAFLDKSTRNESVFLVFVILVIGQDHFVTGQTKNGDW